MERELFRRGVGTSSTFSGPEGRGGSSGDRVAGRRTYRIRFRLDEVRRTVHLDAGENYVGRSTENAVFLPDTRVSRRHAVLRAGPAGLTIEDLGSRNGTFLGGRRVERAEVTAAADLRFGPVRAKVEETTAEDVELGLELDEVTTTFDPAGLELPEPDGQALLTEAWPPESGGAAPEQGPDRLSLVFPPSYYRGSSPAARDLFENLAAATRGDLPVLITGETGVGKDPIAKILHRSSKRREGPLVAINCAAIPAEMLEAEMFGIGQGVATGVSARPGKFRLARGGTLFLDEIGELAPALQAKLLRALQDKEIQPLGARSERVDVRILAATNADLARRIESGKFRSDLYYRLAAHVIEVPALRSRGGDVVGFVEHFLREHSRTRGIPVRGVTTRALRLLSDYPWPGNVRELEHEMHRLVCTLDHGGVIDATCLAGRIRDPARHVVADDPSDDPDSLTLEPRLRALEARLIREALARAGGKRIEAARLLGLSRNGLAKKMKRLGIDV